MRCLHHLGAVAEAFCVRVSCLLRDLRRFVVERRMGLLG